MDYIKLTDLISCLEYGTRLHIGIIFLGRFVDERLTLPRQHTIHAGKICDKCKEMPGGFSKCFMCRNLAIEKAIKQKTDFEGFCINGIYEYTRPVIIDGEVACIIFIGNILKDNKRLERTLKIEPSLKNTLEQNFSAEQCRTVAAIIEGYIQMIFASPKIREQTRNPLIINLKSYIDSNIENDIEIPYLANIFHYNEKYLGRLFKKEIGTSIKDYINSSRIEIAKKLLEKTDCSVIDVSRRVGYNNVTYFNRIFKAKLGVPPTEYRNK